MPGGRWTAWLPGVVRRTKWPLAAVTVAMGTGFYSSRHLRTDTYLLQAAETEENSAKVEFKKGAPPSNAKEVTDFLRIHEQVGRREMWEALWLTD